MSQVEDEVHYLASCIDRMRWCTASDSLKGRSKAVDPALQIVHLHNGVDDQVKGLS